MGIRLHPMTGWPFPLDVRIEYSLGDHGLTVETRARNAGSSPCPFGTGQHPYLSPGTGVLDACTLQLSASTRVLVDDQRQLPSGRQPTAATQLDFHTPRAVGSLVLDDGFCDLQRDRDGLAWVRLTGPDGRTVSLWCDREYPLLQLFTGDTLAPERRRRGLAAEPMTCPANALRTGEGVVTLEPGETFSGRWGVTLS